jgi:glycosyltransferase involved in cell wall biosynthesis
MVYKPKISIITIVFNDRLGLEKTAQSVWEQLYPNIEYLIIDGASTDGTREFIQANKRKVEYWVSEPDNGIADAFNKGVKAAKGEWIVMLNAADYFQNNRVVDQMIPYLYSNRDADIVYGKLTEVDAQGNPGKSFGKPFDKKAFQRECTIIHPATFHNRSFFESNGLFSLDFKIAMDYEIFLRKKDLKAVFADEFITYMEKGGVSQVNPSRTYREFNEVKRLHLGKSEMALAKDYYENMLRYSLSKLKQKLGLK